MLFYIKVFSVIWFLTCIFNSFCCYVNLRIALSWTTQADKFVDTIKSTYTKAWFVESENPPAINETIKQTYFGDLLVEVNRRTESLSSLLCEHQYGRRNDQIFGRSKFEY